MRCVYFLIVPISKQDVIKPTKDFFCENGSQIYIYIYIYIIMTDWCMNSTYGCARH